jgi:transcriptional regulator with XRE-family HTH domain
MKIPADQPLNAAQSRGARFQLGLTQSDVIAQSGLPGYKLKQFETGRVVPDMPFLQKLAEFYTGKGIDLVDAAPTSTSSDHQPALPAKPGSDIVRHVQRPCFYISDSVTPELLDQCLERMHDNDERIDVLLSTPLKGALFGGGHHDETVAQHQELFGAMGENYLIFLLLQGKMLVSPVDGSINAKSHADLLGQFYAKSPVASSLAPVSAKAPVKSLTKAPVKAPSGVEEEAAQ